MVFFDYEQAVVTQAAQKVLDEVAAEFKSGRTKQILVNGHTDTAESSSAMLAKARSHAVASVLIAKGIAPDKIEMSGSGSSKPLAPTKPGTKEPINRRAQIVLK